MLCAYLEENGVDTSYIRESGKASGHAIIQVVNGENCIIVYGGANRDIDAEMIEDVLSDFEQGDLLLLQNEISNVDVLIQKAHAKGMKIVLNPSPIDESLLKGPVAACDILLLNEVEGAALAACAGNSYEEIIHASGKTISADGNRLDLRGAGSFRISERKLSASGCLSRYGRGYDLCGRYVHRVLSQCQDQRLWHKGGIDDCMQSFFFQRAETGGSEEHSCLGGSHTGIG